MRIVSLVPSITETLFDFGLSPAEVVGRTKFCIHPADQIKQVPTIGGTKNLHLNKINMLRPDLIIANKEENDRHQVEELMRDFKVWVTDIQTVEDNKSFLTELGNILSKTTLAEEFNMKIGEIFQPDILNKNVKVAYLIWKDPYMSVGSDTFIHEILSKLGFQNNFSHFKRYPEVSPSDLSAADVIFLSSEPYPFKEKHRIQMQEEFPNQEIILVDGEAFSWFGSHLIQKGAYLHSLAHNFT